MRKTARIALVLAALAGVAPATIDAQTEQLRESWQRVPDLFLAAGVRPGAHIADVGAGDGFLAVRLASAVGPNGRVYAVDIDATITEALRGRLSTAHVTNVDVIVGAEDDPHLPIGTLDGVLILNAYHEMARGVAVLKHVRDALKSGGRLVLCEPVPSAPNLSRAAQMEHHVLDPALIVEDLRTAGFQLVDRQDMFATNLGGTHFGFVVARRP